MNERSFRDLYQLFSPFLPAQSTVGEREIFSFSISKKTSHKNENLARIKRIYRSLVLVVFNLFTSLRFEIGHCPSRPGSRQGKHFFFFFFSMLPFTCHTVTNSIDSLSFSPLNRKVKRLTSQSGTGARLYGKELCVCVAIHKTTGRKASAVINTVP